MKAEHISSSLIILFISTQVFVLASSQSSSISDGSTLALSRDDASNRKSEEDHAEGRLDDDDTLKFIAPSDKRRIGSEFLGKRTVPSYHDFSFEKRRALGSEFLGKRKLGSEFLGKRSEIAQQNPEDYQFFYSNVSEDDEDDIMTNNEDSHASVRAQQDPSATRYTSNIPQYYHPTQFNQANPMNTNDAWMYKLQSLKRGLGSEFLGKRDLYRPSSFNLINKWARAYGPRLPIEHDKKRKLMGSEFLG